jgi:hypothetical protein
VGPDTGGKITPVLWTLVLAFQCFGFPDQCSLGQLRTENLNLLLSTA